MEYEMCCVYTYMCTLYFINSFFLFALVIIAKALEMKMFCAYRND